MNKLKELNPDQIDRKGISQVSLALTNRTRDITPLRALPGLRRLKLWHGPSSLDLSPLNSLPLEELTCDEPTVLRNIRVLREMKSLTSINGRPAAAFLLGAAVALVGVS